LVETALGEEVFVQNNVKIPDGGLSNGLIYVDQDRDNTRPNYELNSILLHEIRILVTTKKTRVLNVDNISESVSVE
jgi:hypothetical protein